MNKKDLLIAFYAFSLFFITSFVVAPIVIYHLSEHPLDFTILPLVIMYFFKAFLHTDHGILAAGAVMCVLAMIGLGYWFARRRQT
jgi:hypothetical protein